jgi:predicted  nucleic acid-binding Zn-ribbon protein
MSDIELKAGWLKRDIQSAAKRAAKTRGTPMSETIEHVIERLEKEADGMATASRTFTDMRYGKDYESMSKEQTIAWIGAQHIRALLAERERLKKKDSEWYDYAKTLLAELDRLREALEKIKQRAYGPDLDKAYHMGAIARAALTAGETK